MLRIAQVTPVRRAANRTKPTTQHKHYAQRSSGCGNAGARTCRKNAVSMRKLNKLENDLIDFNQTC
ncbi:hypothetical protein A2U01_0063200 [Trifolium medium]|uniref:Uncharacterized protein n=1 Tax=Trifolium medium TaxID=97028 RepID=A0A392S282_9FABA|nr:hypothetical protein [Trifolium medium]